MVNLVFVLSLGWVLRVPLHVISTMTYAELVTKKLYGLSCCNFKTVTIKNIETVTRKI
jgi:hypothetical protein